MTLGARIKVEIDKRSMRRTLAKIAAIDAKVAKKSVKTGIKTAGSKMLKSAKDNAPRGKTGLFRRTLAKRERSYGRSTRHVAIVGQRYKKQFPPKSRSSARRKNHGLSTGLSGQGLVTPIHLVESRTRAHVIKPKKNRGPKAWLAYIPRRVMGKNGKMRAGGKRDIVFAKAVRHPGTKGTKFLAVTAKKNRFMPIAVMRAQLEADLRALGGTP